MRLYSTNNPQYQVGLQEAVFKGLPPDNGLFMPTHIPTLPEDFLKNLSEQSFETIALTVAKALLGEDMSEADIEHIIQKAVNFPAPVTSLNPHTHVLELYHGPSLAFKDFGARFMAQTMSHFNRDTDQELVILVATSGDTGGAVAAGFYQTPGIQVVILYPSGKVSPLQEKQLTTLGHNITAIEVQGTFDDCQALVKKAFLDKDLTSTIRLSSANSINIARLIPQSFYYFEGWKQAVKNTGSDGTDIVFSVPSGNFGNLTAGLLAKRMGLPVRRFIAATNANDVVPAYLETGTYQARPSLRTLSNAMDVGNPSNFARMLDLYGAEWASMKADIKGYAFSDADTQTAMREVFQRYGYILDPHGAVGYLALEAYRREDPSARGIVLETAHPAKFLEDVEQILERPIEVPERLASLAHKEKSAVLMGIDFDPFKNWLQECFG